MAKQRKPDYSNTVYHCICNHAQATGEFPPAYRIAERVNLEYRTVYNCLKLLESRGLIECRRGKRVNGVLQVERRLKRPATKQPARSQGK